MGLHDFLVSKSYRIVSNHSIRDDFYNTCNSRVESDIQLSIYEFVVYSEPRHVNPVHIQLTLYQLPIIPKTHTFHIQPPLSRMHVYVLSNINARHVDEICSTNTPAVSAPTPIQPPRAH